MTAQLDMFADAAPQIVEMVSSLMALPADDRKRTVKEHWAAALDWCKLTENFSGPFEAMMDSLPQWTHVPIDKRPESMRDATYCFCLATPLEQNYNGWATIAFWRDAREYLGCIPGLLSIPSGYPEPSLVHCTAMCTLTDSDDRQPRSTRWHLVVRRPDGRRLVYNMHGRNVGIESLSTANADWVRPHSSLLKQLRETPLGTEIDGYIAEPSNDGSCADCAFGIPGFTCPSPAPCGRCNEERPDNQRAIIRRAS